MTTTTNVRAGSNLSADGTADIPRHEHLGRTGLLHKELFTRVLKTHTALASIVRQQREVIDS